MPSIALDTLGLNWLLPMLRTSKEINSMEAGDIAKVTTTVMGSLKDMESFLQPNRK